MTQLNASASEEVNTSSFALNQAFVNHLIPDECRTTGACRNRPLIENTGNAVPLEVQWPTSHEVSIRNVQHGRSEAISVDRSGRSDDDPRRIHQIDIAVGKQVSIDG